MPDSPTAPSPTGRLSKSEPEMQYFPGTPQALAQRRRLKAAVAQGNTSLVDFASLEARLGPSDLTGCPPDAQTAKDLRGGTQPYRGQPYEEIYAALSDLDVFVLAMQLGEDREAWHGQIFVSKDAFVMLVSQLRAGESPQTFAELLGYLRDDEQWLGETLLSDHELAPVATVEGRTADEARTAASDFAHDVLGRNVA